ncbi:hypothetical protein [Luteolibacter soli]|uniref:RapA2 cadherin-like domain-containing protein n=1 Tax=Luteolibacter soli TaxID=3135280 RepID=A0ABU9AXR3_9BACT
MTAYADPSAPEAPVNGSTSTAATAAMEGPASSAEPSDPFAVALAILNGEAAPAEAGREILPPLADCLHPEEQSSVSSAQLAEGKVSSFRIGAEGVDQVTVSEDGGLQVGLTAVDTHVIEIAGNGGIKAGTYTLIDYKGAIGGAGFSGLVLHSTPDLHAELVNNTAETKIELVVSEAGAPQPSEAASGIGNLLGGSSLWSLFDETGTYLLDDETVSENPGILGLLGSAAKVSDQDALQ